MENPANHKSLGNIALRLFNLMQVNGSLTSLFSKSVTVTLPNLT
jgi:hypothetical protein